MIAAEIACRTDVYQFDLREYLGLDRHDGAEPVLRIGVEGRDLDDVFEPTSPTFSVAARIANARRA